MRAVIQRVKFASVKINGQISGAIEHGMLVLLGIANNDEEDDATWLCQKIYGLRIFNDPNGLMNLSLKETNGQILLVSQFTLFASTKKGNRPSFMLSAKPELAIPLYQYAIQQLEMLSGKKVETGVFGADMQVELLNDGPVTIIIDSKNRE